MVTPQRFWILLLLTTAITVLSLWLWDNFLPSTEALTRFPFLCVGVFALINVAAFYLGVKSVHSKSKYRFIHLTMFLIMVKMLICFGLVVIYVQVNHPGSKLFVLPFLTSYLIFTCFEIYVLEKIARTKPGPVQT